MSCDWNKLPRRVRSLFHFVVALEVESHDGTYWASESSRQTMYNQCYMPLGAFVGLCNGGTGYPEVAFRSYYTNLHLLIPPIPAGCEHSGDVQLHRDARYFGVVGFRDYDGVEHQPSCKRGFQHWKRTVAQGPLAHLEHR